MLLGVIHHIVSIVGITGLECSAFRHQTMVFFCFFVFFKIIFNQVKTQQSKLFIHCYYIFFEANEVLFVVC